MLGFECTPGRLESYIYLQFVLEFGAGSLVTACSVFPLQGGSRSSRTAFGRSPRSDRGGRGCGEKEWQPTSIKSLSALELPLLLLIVTLFLFRQVENSAY